jgi:hypothetical protein
LRTTADEVGTGHNTIVPGQGKGILDTGSIFQFIWIAAFAGMTIKILISSRYNSRHTRVGRSPGGKVTFYDFINISEFTFFTTNIGNEDNDCYFIYSRKPASTKNKNDRIH